MSMLMIRGMIMRSNFMRSKLPFFMSLRSKLAFCKNDQEIEMALGALRGLG
jgi:hypothetical protein